MDDIPSGLDVLLAHSELPNAVLRRALPRVHASGHFHAQHGVRFRGRQDARPPGLAAQVKELRLREAKPFAPPPGEADERRIEVNAALCDQNYAPINEIIVLDLPVRLQVLLCTTRFAQARLRAVGCLMLSVQCDG